MSVFLTILLDLSLTTSSSITTLHLRSKATFNFNRLPRTFNSLPVLVNDLNQSFQTIKAHLLNIFWQLNISPTTLILITFIVFTLFAPVQNLLTHLIFVLIWSIM